MRRASFIGPLLLIGIGAVLLARNIYPELRLLDYVARYWPYVLIAWGALRVVEILIWKARSQPLPRGGISSGEWVLAIFIMLAGTSLHAIQGFRDWPGTITMGGVELFGERFDYPLSAEKATTKTPRVILEDFRGDAQISGVDSESVKVAGQLSVRALDQASADEIHNEVPLEISGDENRVVVRLRHGRFASRQVTMSLEITVPKGASVAIEGRSGDLRVTSIDGSVDLKGRGSDIELVDIAGPVSVDGAFNGVVNLQHLGKPVRFRNARTELSIERIPGELRLALGDVRASNVVGPLKLNSRSHDVTIENVSGAVDLDVERGDLDLRPEQLPLSRIQARVRRGDIALSLPPNAQFTMDASTNNGDIRNDFGGSLKLESIGRRSTLTGTVGNGASIELQTERGGIVVRMAGTEPRTRRAEAAAPSNSGPPKQIQSTQPLEKLEQ